MLWAALVLAAASERPCEALLRFCLATLGILYKRTSRSQDFREEEVLRIDFNVGNFFWPIRLPAAD
jgi:hypothetical protein